MKAKIRYIGLDVHKDTIVIGVPEAGRGAAEALGQSRMPGRHFRWPAAVEVWPFRSTVCHCGKSCLQGHVWCPLRVDPAGLFGGPKPILKWKVSLWSRLAAS